MTETTYPLPDGARLERLSPFQKGDKLCQHHRLHLAFLHCGRRAEYLLIKKHGEKVRLCEQHASELQRRFDNSSPEHPREDESYGWPGPIVDLNWSHPDAPEPEPEKPAFEREAFAGGRSGGGGGGDTWADSNKQEDERAATAGSDVLPEAVSEAVQAEAPEPEPMQAEASEPLESTPVEQDTSSSMPDVSSSIDAPADAPEAPAES